MIKKYPDGNGIDIHIKNEIEKIKEENLNLQKRNNSLSEEIMELTEKSNNEIYKLRTQLVEYETNLDKYHAELDVKTAKILFQAQEFTALKDIVEKKDKDIAELINKLKSYEVLIKVQKKMLGKPLDETSHNEINCFEKENELRQRTFGFIQEIVNKNKAHTDNICRSSNKQNDYYEYNPIKCRGCGELISFDVFATHKKICIHKKDSDNLITRSKSITKVIF